MGQGRGTPSGGRDSSEECKKRSDLLKKNQNMGHEKGGIAESERR